MAEPKRPNESTEAGDTDMSSVLQVDERTRQALRAILDHDNVDSALALLSGLRRQSDEMVERATMGAYRLLRERNSKLENSRSDRAGAIEALADRVTGFGRVSIISIAVISLVVMVLTFSLVSLRRHATLLETRVERVEEALRTAESARQQYPARSDSSAQQAEESAVPAKR